MKSKLLTLSAFVALSAVSNAAVTFSGTALFHAFANNTANQVGSNILGLVVVDTTGTGSFASLNGTVASASDPQITSSAAGLDVGTTFGGDLVIAKLTSAVIGVNTNYTGNAVASVDMSAYLNKRFYIVWFDAVANTATGTAANGTHYGIVSASNWLTPSSNTGNLTFGSSGNFAQITDTATGAATAVNGTVSLATNGASFTVGTVVPEPSAALLGGLGLLGLLRRRR